MFAALYWPVVSAVQAHSGISPLWSFWVSVSRRKPEFPNASTPTTQSSKKTALLWLFSGGRLGNEDNSWCFVARLNVYRLRLDSAKRATLAKIFKYLRWNILSFNSFSAQKCINGGETISIPLSGVCTSEFGKGMRKQTETIAGHTKRDVHFRTFCSYRAMGFFIPKWCCCSLLFAIAWSPALARHIIQCRHNPTPLFQTPFSTHHPKEPTLHNWNSFFFLLLAGKGELNDMVGGVTWSAVLGLKTFPND